VARSCRCRAVSVDRSIAVSQERCLCDGHFVANLRPTGAASRKCPKNLKLEGARISVLLYVVGMRRTSLPVRFSRALVGFVTLWCLGCSSYEPLLGSLLGFDAVGMRCDGGARRAGVDQGISAATSEKPASVAISAPTDARDFDCGCGGSCHAPSPTMPVRPVKSELVARASDWRVEKPASVSRTPLLPPPEAVA